MGHTQTLSYSNSHYMFLFIDDFIMFTWMYFVTEKSKVLLKFQKFKLTVESALKRIIKRLCIVNGRDRFFFVCKEYNIKR